MIMAHDKGTVAHGIIKMIKVYFIKNNTECYDVRSAVIFQLLNPCCSALFACLI